MKQLPAQLLAIWRQLGLNQRVSLILTTVAVIGGMTGLVLWSHRPRMQLLYGKLGSKEAGEIVQAIQAQGVTYEIGAGGTAIYVPAEKVYTLRMELASKGLPGGDGVGFEIFDKSNFGVSDFVQHTNYLRALQGELSRTISQLSGVRSARVMVVVPENKLLLADSKTRPTASVFIDGSISTDSVNSIRFLVANSVEGLKVDDVAVVDSHGNALSEKLRDDPTLASASSQMKLRKGLEDYFANKVESMLLPVVGPGNAVVRVSAELNNETSTVTQEKYDPDGQVVRSQTTTDDSTTSAEGKPAGGGGGVGTTANTPARPGSPDADGGANAQRKTEETRKNQTQTYEISRATTNTTKNPGDIKRLSAAVFVALRTSGTGANAKPEPRTADEMKSLRQAVASALGVNAPNGVSDANSAITVQEIAFRAPVADTLPTSAMSGGGIVDSVRPWVAPGVAVGVILYFLRQLKRTKPEEIPLELLDPSRPLPATVVENAQPAKMLRDKGVRGPVSPEMLNEMIKQKPDNVSAALREWMTAKNN